MKILSGLAILLLFFVGYVVSISRWDTTKYSQQEGTNYFGGYFEYKGTVNIKSNRSRGSGGVNEIIDSATKVGLDFLILTDSDLVPFEDNIGSYYGDLLLLSEREFSVIGSRYQVYSRNKAQWPSQLESAKAKVADFISKDPKDHPADTLILTGTFPSQGMNVSEVPFGIDGIEVWNPKNTAQRAWYWNKGSALWSLLLYPFNPKLSFLRLSSEASQEIQLWDQLLSKRFVFGISGSEASARAVPWSEMLVRFPSYASSLEIFSNHVLTPSELTGNYRADRIKILEALAKGRFYMALDLLGDPVGFQSFLVSQSRRWPMGSIVKWQKAMQIEAKLKQIPKEFYEIVLYKNGQRVATSNNYELTAVVDEPGVYRLEVRVAVKFPIPDGKKWVSWILTNPYKVLSND
jgi:hypothetical protein